MTVEKGGLGQDGKLINKQIDFRLKAIQEELEKPNIPLEKVLELTSAAEKMREKGVDLFFRNQRRREEIEREKATTTPLATRISSKFKSWKEKIKAERTKRVEEAIAKKTEQREKKEALINQEKELIRRYQEKLTKYSILNIEMYLGEKNIDEINQMRLTRNKLGDELKQLKKRLKDFGREMP